ncbi:hypothetical protein BDZ91DRAFT_764795 [Kalaharituber pfeilii]|nr:hypothetical protein BDZ91DRAFT_764795 [Kalaharituber pfeilii]
MQEQDQNLVVKGRGSSPESIALSKDVFYGNIHRFAFEMPTRTTTPTRQSRGLDGREDLLGYGVASANSSGTGKAPGLKPMALECRPQEHSSLGNGLIIRLAPSRTWENLGKWTVTYCEDAKAWPAKLNYFIRPEEETIAIVVQLRNAKETLISNITHCGLVPSYDSHRLQQEHTSGRNGNMRGFPVVTGRNFFMFLIASASRGLLTVGGIQNMFQTELTTSSSLDNSIIKSKTGSKFSCFNNGRDRARRFQEPNLVTRLEPNLELHSLGPI